MNWRRIPVLPTLLVLVACGYMVHLGLWQLDRLRQKEAMIARFSAAQADRAVRDWGQSALPYARVRLSCLNAYGTSATAGRSQSQESGWAHGVRCDVAGGGKARIVLGWSRNSQTATWSGGEVIGTLVDHGVRGTYDRPVTIVADPPLAGLQANAKPDPRDLPNNHLSYAVQWFAFALTALVIYALALRKRLKAQATP
jgi:surfeit locus 1 family protein